MNVPRWFAMFLSEHFTGAQVETITQYWYQYNQLSFSNSTREELLNAARAILVIRAV